MPREEQRGVHHCEVKDGMLGSEVKDRTSVDVSDSCQRTTVKAWPPKDHFARKWM